MNSKPVSTPYNQTVLVGTRWGMMLGLQCDPFQTATLLLYGEWAREEVNTICSVLKPGDVALDIGANIGTVAVAMAKKVGTTGYVFAFEPQRAAFCCLCANTALTHNLKQLEPIKAAVSDVDGVISVPLVDVDKPFNVGGVRLDDPDYNLVTKLPSEEVSCVRIDSLQLQRCDLMKIDVETMESKVLSGALQTITRCRPVIFAETMCDLNNAVEKRNVEAMRLIFDSLKYDTRRFSPPLFSKDNIRFCPDEIFPGTDHGLIAWPPTKDKPEWFLKLEAW